MFVSMNSPMDVWAFFDTEGLAISGHLGFSLLNLDT